MLTLHDRRGFLRLGGAGLFSLPALLQAQSAQAAERKAKAKSVLLVFLGGGLSHHDTFDLKPEASEDIRGPYKGIATSVPGLTIGEKLPQLAKVMDKVALVRSASHSNDHHETATNWVLSGRFGSPFGDHPAIGAVAAHHFGFTAPLPPYVAVPKNPSFTWELGKSAYLGGRCESFKAGDPGIVNYAVPDMTADTDPTHGRHDRRQSLRQAVDNLAKTIEGNDQIATYDEFQKRAAEMVLSDTARKAFAITEETAAVRDRYGRAVGQSLLLARRLVEAGVKFVTVNYPGWDHHKSIFPSLDKKLPELDTGLSALVQDLHDRGTLKDTLLVVMGEFGRTPKLNKDAGRDHWGPAGSLLLAGAGIKGGTVLGKTDKLGATVTQRPVAPADVAFTMLECLGIDPRKTLTTVDGRPVEVLDQGAFLHELWA